MTTENTKSPLDIVGAPAQPVDDGGPAADATLRDLFGGHALIGILSNRDGCKTSSGEEIRNVDDVAALAWKQADAMIRARQS